MVLRYGVPCAAALVLAGCVATTPVAPPAVTPVGDTAWTPEVAAQSFTEVVARMEPVIESECLAAMTVANCDFLIVVDARPGLAPNAYQTLDRFGRPVISFTIGLIAEARNADELAFVMGHEAAHHIAGHIPRQQREAMTGALVLGGLTALTGGDDAAVRTAQRIGGTIAARRYAKKYELEADALGTVLTWKAGFDPERGAAFFTRIPDPGDAFLGTHPPNAARIQTVRRVVDSLRNGA